MLGILLSYIYIHVVCIHILVMMPPPLHCCPILWHLGPQLRRARKDAILSNTHGTSKPGLITPSFLEARFACFRERENPPRNFHQSHYTAPTSLSLPPNLYTTSHSRTLSHWIQGTDPRHGDFYRRRNITIKSRENAGFKLQIVHANGWLAPTNAPPECNLVIVPISSRKDYPDKRNLYLLEEKSSCASLFLSLPLQTT